MILKKTEDSISQIVAHLIEGNVVILPTDTVYGFSSIVNVQKKNINTFCTDIKIKQIKGRQENKPLIQLIAKPDDIFLYTDQGIPQSLLKKWPGALTIIVPIKKDCSLYKFYPTVAFRCPGDLWLRNIIELCNAPIFSTSVNRSGHAVLENINQIISEFSNDVSLIIDDGNKTNAKPSTLVSIENNNIKVLRQGDVIVDL